MLRVLFIPVLLLFTASAAVSPAKLDSKKWVLWYSEDFSTPLNDTMAPWILENYSDPFDNINDDSEQWFANDYGPAWYDALESFATYRKEFSVGRDSWLTASLSARDWNKDGIIESPPLLRTKLLGDSRYVAELHVPDHTGGVLFRNTRPLPSEYRIEYKLMTLDFGGKRNGTLEYDGRINGYSTNGCKTRHPWGSGSKKRPGWSGNASVPYCEWEDLREGVTGYNGFSFLTITDFSNPAPRNNRFYHYHRKVLMDAFSQHPNRFGNTSGGQVCDSKTNEYYDFRDSNYNTVSMWISGLPNKWAPNPGGNPDSSQWFMSTCSDGVAERSLQFAAEMQPERMPNEFYTFAVERNKTGYTLEVSGNFARVGNKTLRFHRPFIVDDNPIWHYNVDPSEYDGRYNADLVQNDFAFGSMTWPDQWPAGSAYPDYFAIGDVYTNAYEGKASLTDIRMYGLATDAPPTPPVEEDVTSRAPSVPPTPLPQEEVDTSLAPSGTESPPIMSGAECTYRAVVLAAIVWCLLAI